MFAIEKLTSNEISWQHFSVGPEALRGRTADCDTVCFGLRWLSAAITGQGLAVFAPAATLPSRNAI